MSWLRRILADRPVITGEFYTAVDPADFYEWSFSQTIPKGTVFTPTAPPSDTFTQGYVVAAAKIRPDQLNGEGKLNEDAHADLDLRVGSASSPKELLIKFDRMKKDFTQKIDSFKTAAIHQRYFLFSKGKHVHLYKLDDSDGMASITDFGNIDEIKEKLAQARQVSASKAATKKGRAYELEEFRRFENILTMVSNSNVPIDCGRVDFVLKVAQIKPVQKSSIDWQECYTRFSPEGRDLEQRIASISSLKWVQAGLHILHR